jgi:hypothetical protein
MKHDQTSSKQIKRELPNVHLKIDDEIQKWKFTYDRVQKWKCTHVKVRKRLVINILLGNLGQGGEI